MSTIEEKIEDYKDEILASPEMTNSTLGDIADSLEEIVKILKDISLKM